MAAGFIALELHALAVSAHNIGFTDNNGMCMGNGRIAGRRRLQGSRCGRIERGGIIINCLIAVLGGVIIRGRGVIVGRSAAGSVDKIILALSALVPVREGNHCSYPTGSSLKQK